MKQILIATLLVMSTIMVYGQTLTNSEYNYVRFVVGSNFQPLLEKFEPVADTVQTVELNLTWAEAQLVTGALAERPWREVFELVPKFIAVLREKTQLEKKVPTPSPTKKKKE